jgi:hypothetical protein
MGDLKRFWEQSQKTVKLIAEKAAIKKGKTVVGTHFLTEELDSGTPKAINST